MGTESSKWLYDQLTKRGYNVGKDQAEFDSLMSSNDESRRWAFETARKSGLNVGADYDEFSSLVVGGGGAAPHADATPAARVNLNRFSLAPKEMRDALRAGDGHADIIDRSRPINSTSGSGISEGSDGSEGLMSGDAVTSDSKQGEQAQGNWQPTMQQRIAMAHDFNMMTAQGEAAMNNIGENSKRSFERFTPEGRRRQELARMKAVAHGIDTKLVGAVPEAPKKKETGNQDGDSINNFPTGVSPTLYDVVTDEDGKKVAQWLMPDGSLSTSRIDASIAEGLAQQGRERMRFEQRMKGSGLDPKNPEDVKKQLQADAEAEQKQMQARLGQIARDAVEAAWAAAQKRQREDENRNADKAWDNHTGGKEAGLVNAAREMFSDNVSHNKNFDLDRLMDDAWNRMDKGTRRTMVEVCSSWLKKMYPGARQPELRAAAEHMARGQSDMALYNYAVEQHAPKSTTEYIFRQAKSMNLINSLSEGVARSASGTTGDLAAKEQAMGQYGKEHWVANAVGTVGGMLADPVTLLTAPIGGAAANMATSAAGRLVGATLGRSAALGTRLVAKTTAGRLGAAAVGGGAGFGAYEMAKEAESQFVHGGHVNAETGENDGYSGWEIAKAGGHGVVMGAAVGGIPTLFGNVADKVVRATSNTVGKAAVRGGEFALSKLTEGTVFSIPEWISGEEDAFDVWRGNMALIGGFAATHGMKSAGKMVMGTSERLNSLRPIKPQPGRELTASERAHNNRTFMQKIGEMLDGNSGKFNPELEFTNEELDELRNAKYGSLADLFRSEQKADALRDKALRKEAKEKAKNGGGSAARDGHIKFNSEPIEEVEAETLGGEFDGFRLMDELMHDGNVSESTRAKAYYIVTGQKLQPSTVTGVRRIEAADGHIYIQSLNAAGEVVTSRRFKTERGARSEEALVYRQVELNSIDVGEKYSDAEANRIVLAKAFSEAVPDMDFESALKIYEKVKSGAEDVTAQEAAIVERMDHVISFYRNEGDHVRPAAIRASVSSEYGIDVDQTLKKERADRTKKEQEVVDEYTRRLYQSVSKGGLAEENPEYVNNRGGVSEYSEESDYSDGSEVQVDERAHRDSGEIIEATLKVGDRKVYIIKGDVVMNADGVGVDTRASSDMVRVRDAETGEEFFISPDRIASVSEPVAAMSADAADKDLSEAGGAVEDMSDEFREGYSEGLDSRDLSDDELAESIAEFEAARDNSEEGLSEKGLGWLAGLMAERERRAGVNTQEGSEDNNSAAETDIISESNGADAENFVTSQYGNRSEQNNDGLAEREDRGRVAGDTAGSVEADRDRSDIRVYEEGLGTSSLTHSEYSERTRRNAESERLVGIARTNGQFLDRHDVLSRGDKHKKSSGESEVSIDYDNKRVYKIKNPYAKSPMKGNVQPEDAILEHLVHNKYFPETRYQFEGISEDIGDARIVLSQDYIESVGQPTEEQIEAALAEKGLLPDGKYRYGNDEISVTDVTGDNALLGADGKVYFIDPIIDFKKPVREIIGEPQRDFPAADGNAEPAGSADISTENEVSDAENASETASTVGNGQESALSRIPVDEVSGEPMFEAVDAETGWLGLLEAAQSDSERAGNIASKQADQARGELEALERKPPVRKNVKLKGSPMAMLKAEEEADRAYEKAVMEHAQKIEDAKSRYAAWREIVKVKTERERIEREERQRQAEAEEEARIMENRERLRREAEEREAAQSALKEQHEQAQRMAIEQLEDEERQRLQEESRAENVEKRQAFNNYEEAMDAERRAIIANHGEGLRSELAGRIQEARGGKAYGQIYGALDGDGVATLEEWVARNLSLGGRRVQWNGHGNLGGQIFGSSEGDKVSERRQYGWMTSDNGESFYEFVHKMWETLMGDESVQFNRADVTDMDVRNMVIDLLRNHPTSRGLFEHAIDLYDSRTMSEGARDALAEMEHYEKEIRDDWYNKNYGLSFDDYEARVENIYEELSRSKLSDEDAYEIASMIADEQAAMSNNNITNYETGNDGARQSGSEVLHGQQPDRGQRDGTVAAGESASVIGRGDSSGRGVSTPSESGLDSGVAGRLGREASGDLSEKKITALLSESEKDEFGKPINSAGIFKKKYSRNKPEVHSRPALGSGKDTDTTEVDSGHSMGATAPAGNSSMTSGDKFTTLTADKQYIAPNSSEKETVAKTEPPQPNNAVSSDSSLSEGEQRGISSSEPNGESSVSDGKGNTLAENTQAESRKSETEHSRNATDKNEDLPAEKIVNGYKIGDEVMWNRNGNGKWERVRIKDFDTDGDPIFEAAKGVMSEKGDWNRVKPVDGIFGEAKRVAAQARAERANQHRKDNQGNPIDDNGKLVIEEVKTISEITDDDFINPSRNIGLPKLSTIVSDAIGANGRKPIIKKNIFEKNRNSHRDLTAEDGRRILNDVLYNPDLYGQNQKSSRPYNWILVHLADRNSSVILEVNPTKENLEIVNWHYLKEETLERKKRQAIKEGGLILTLSEDNAAADTLNNLSSEGKGTNKYNTKQIKREQSVDDLFGGLFDEPISDEKKTDLQPRPGTAERERGHESQSNESLGESQRNATEGSDRRGVDKRGVVDSLSDQERGRGVSRLAESKSTIGHSAVSEGKNIRNNHAERGVDYAPKGEDARIKANIEAIELAKRLLDAGEAATPEQMAVLRKFSGWGGLGKAFDDKGESPTSKRLRALLGEKGYQDAVDSRRSAYYTPANVIDAMWDVARALGFKGGNVLEGSAGIGNILGLMPADMSERSSIHAVEIDSTTGGILSLLYPDAQVDIQGFEKTKVRNNSVDLAITNVPFITGARVFDETGDKDLSKKFRDIHDFCIAKNIRKLREGGLGIFITSSGTMDNSKELRRWIGNEGSADVIGAFRMHNKTFGGTGATSDIIVVRKRVNGKPSPNAIDVTDVTGVRVADYDTGETRMSKGQLIPIVKQLPMTYNKYFAEHPECMAGEMMFNFERGETRFPTSSALFPSSGKPQEKMLSEWARKFATMKEEKPTRKVEDEAIRINEKLGEGTKEGSMVLNSKGELCMARMGEAVPIGLNKNKVKGHTKAECFEDYTAIKKALSDVLEYQSTNDDNAGLEPLLKELNRAFDAFTKKYGNLHKNTAISFLRNDVDFSSILALETYSEKGDKNGNKVVSVGKTDVFSRRVVETEKELQPTTVKDGILASLYKSGGIDVEYISETLGMTADDVKREIVKSGLGYENPSSGLMEVSYKYLSGNVREKLHVAQENNENGKYDANIAALEKVMPMTIPAHLIEFSLGSSWIEPKLYEDFVKEKTGIQVTLTNVGGTWFMKTPWSTFNEKNRAMAVTSTMCGKTIMGHELIEAAITNRQITVSKQVKRYNGATETITDKAATAECSTKIEEIRSEFKDWARERMQSDAEMSARIEQSYNDQFNNYVPMLIPDEFVPQHFGGQVSELHGQPFALRPHQGKAVVRGTTEPILLAHEVGTGKTYTLITTAMEMRRLGTARKPMIVVQNATVGQFVASAKEIYPNAKVLTIEEADRSAEGRKNFYAKIKYNDWDMIVVPQSVFERIPDSPEREMAYIQDIIEEKMKVLEAMREVDGAGRSMIVRQAEKELEAQRDRIAELTEIIQEKQKKRDGKREATSRQNAEVRAMEMLDREVDDVEDFDEMGIDAILVDEAHEYKHLGFATAMQRGVKGIDPSYSKKSQGVYLKTQSVMERNNGRNVVFATGTPISNTAAEIWTFMRYLMPADQMKAYGIYYFDDFVRNFGNLAQMVEFKTNGKFAEVNRFAGYVNLPELVRLWSSVADTVLTREAGGVKDKIPEMEGGTPQDIYLPQTRALRSVMKYVKSELDKYENMTGKEKKENSHIPLTMYGIAKAAAVDARLVIPNAEDDPNSKTNATVRETLRSLKESAKYKGTVAIFSDNYQNKRSGFNLYEDIRTKLIAEGIPADQIVVMKSGMSVKKKLEIFDKVNSGEVRVILGSTFTLGTGVNIQERLHTLIHVDAPNRPMDYTQRNGRALRQGNLHKDMGIPVRIIRFGVEDSLDVTAYQRLKTKGAIADSIMNGSKLMQNSMENRVLEEEEDSFGDMTAQLSGSEYAILKNQAEREVRNLTAKQKGHDIDQIYVHNQLPKVEGLIKGAKRRIEVETKNLETIGRHFPDGTIKKITVGKLSFDSLADMEDFFKKQNAKMNEAAESIREGSDNWTSRLTIDVDGVSFEVTTTVSREVDNIGQGTLSFEPERKVTYSCEALGIKERAVKGNRLKNVMQEIAERVVTGAESRELLSRGQSQLARYSEDYRQLQERNGKEFPFKQQLAEAKERLSHYEEAMKKELAEKEAKYAEMDKSVDDAIDISLTEEDEDGVEYRTPEEGIAYINARAIQPWAERLEALRHKRDDMGLSLSEGERRELRELGSREKAWEERWVEEHGETYVKTGRMSRFDFYENQYGQGGLSAEINRARGEVGSLRDDNGRLISAHARDLARRALPAIERRRAQLLTDRENYSAKGQEAIDSELAELEYMKLYYERMETGEDVERTMPSRIEHQRMLATGRELASSLGERVVMHENPSDIEDSDYNRKIRKQRSYGWYDPNDGTIHVNVGLHQSTDEIARTVLHELIGHKSIENIMGKQRFNRMIDEVWKHAGKKVRAKIAEKMGKHNWDFRKATKEYLAELAEDVNNKGFEHLEREQKSLWQRVKSKIQDFLNRILEGLSIPAKIKLTENDLSYMMWKLFKHQQRKTAGKPAEGDIFDKAEEMARREKWNRSGESLSIVARDGGDNMSMADRARAIINQKSIEIESHDYGKTELKEIYSQLRPVYKDGREIVFYNSAFGKNYRPDGNFAKVIPQLSELLEHSQFAYSEPDKLGGTQRIDGTSHRPHPNVKSFDNYVAKAKIGSQEYFVRMTIQNPQGNSASGVHSSMVTNVELYENPAKLNSLPTIHGGAVNYDRITDAKLREFFENAKKNPENLSDYMREPEQSGDGGDMDISYRAKEDMDGNTGRERPTNLPSGVSELRAGGESIVGIEKLSERAQQKLGKYLEKYHSAPMIVLSEEADIEALPYPADVKEQMLNVFRNADNGAAYNHYDKKVCIFADRFENDNHKEYTLNHENIHRAIAPIDEEAVPMLTSIRDRILDSGYMNDLMSYLYEEVSKDYPEVKQAEEFMAYMLPWALRKPERVNQILSLLDDRQREFIQTTILNFLYNGQLVREATLQMAGRVRTPRRGDNVYPVRREAPSDGGVEEAERRGGTGDSSQHSVSGSGRGGGPDRFIDPERQNSIGDRREGNAEVYAATKGLVESAGLPVVEISDAEAQSMFELTNRSESGTTATDNGEAARYSIETYHGTGADFDSFDFSHMGAGEGNQAFGWGGYVTGVKGIGQYYAKATSNKPLLDGKPFDHSQKSESFPSQSIEYTLARNYGDVEAAIKWYDEMQAQWDSIPRGENTRQPVFGVAAAWLRENGHRISMPTKHLYTVAIPEDNGRNYINWDVKADREMALQVIDRLGALQGAEWISEAARLRHENRNIDSIEGFRYDYEALASVLGSDKAASEILSSLGYTGIKYPADYYGDQNADGAKNYVVFKEDDMKITDHVRYLRDGRGQVYGWTVGGKIYLNRDAMNPETPIHEYTHIWDDMVKNRKPELWKRGVELLKQTPLWDEVKNDPNYSNIRDDEDAIASEVHSRLTGENGARVMADMIEEAKGKGIIEEAKAAGLVGRLKNWLKEMFRELKATLSKWSKADLKNLTVDDFVNMTLRDLAEGMNPREKMRNGEQADKRVNLNAMSHNRDEFDAVRERAVAERGIVVPGLADKVVRVVDVPRHDFAGSGKQALKAAEKWAKDNIVGIHQGTDSAGNTFDYSISNDAVEKYVSNSATKKSDNIGVHLASLKKLPEIISSSEEVEIHPDYTKVNGERNATNEINPKTLVHRFYGAANIDGAVYRIKTTMRENVDKNKNTVAHSYEVAKIELVEVPFDNISNMGEHLAMTSTDSKKNGQTEAPSAEGNYSVEPVAMTSTNSNRNELVEAPFANNVTDEPVAMTSSNSISAAKLLNGVEKSYEPGVKVLDVSEKTQDNAGDSPKFHVGTGGLGDAIEHMQNATEAENSDNLRAKRDAMKAIGGNLSKLRQAMARQREYDTATVRSVTDLAKKLLEANLLDAEKMTRGQFKRILGLAAGVVGRQSVKTHVNKLMDIMVDSQLKVGKDMFEKLLSIKGSKVDARGIEVQGKLDPDGQKVARVVKKTYKLPMESIEERINDALDRMGSSSGSIADEAALEHVGLLIAKQYAENVTNSKAEEKALRESIEQAKAEKDAGLMTPEAYRQYVAATEDAIRENKLERVEALRELSEQLGGVLGESIERAKEWREAEKQRVEDIQHNANSDMAGRPTDEHHKDSRLQKIANNSFVRFMLAPLGTFDQMLRVFGNKNVRGEGYLWNRYMRGWVEATEKEYTGYRDAINVLDNKVSEVFGRKMKWSDLFKVDRKLPKASVRFMDGGEMKEHELTQGNLLYIYMVDKMSDGRMKLRKMGISEMEVGNITAMLDPRFKQLADWMQDEFLVEKREEYNEVYKRMFGTSMAAIENYFPLKILSNARTEQVDITDPDSGTPLPSTTTGSVIKRTRNNLALDVTGANAFSVILDHLQQMERWQAFAEFNRDLNTLLSYKRFRNQVFNMTTAYGAGKTLWNKFRDACRMASGEYRPPIAALDKAAVNIAKGVTAAKVSFRMFTALKQLLSAPAYLSDSNPLYLAQNIANPAGAWKWSMENLPLFDKRWNSRMAGDPRLLKTDMDWKMWRRNVVEIASRIGMSPNAFVDAMTVAIGARSMYQTRLAKYKRMGYDEASANKRAKQDATILFNQTQQSSENAFLSTMQVDRSWLSVLFTVFRNSSMSYTRQLYDAMRNIARRTRSGYKSESIGFMAKQMVRDGIAPDKAASNAKREYNRSWMRDVVRVGVFGAILQFAWNLGAYIPYLLLGDDDEEKDAMLRDVANHTLFGSIEGLTGGDVMSAAGQMIANGDGNPAYLTKEMPLVGDVTSILGKLNKDEYSALNDIVNLVVQSGIGVNPQSITDAVVGIIDFSNGDLETSREAALLISRIMNAPQSQLDKVYFDELAMSGEEARRLTPLQIAQRYARYKMMREAPLTGWMRTEEERDSIAAKREKRALDVAKDNLNNAVSTDVTRKLLAELDAHNKKEREFNQLEATDPEAAWKAMEGYYDGVDWRRIGLAEDYKSRIKELTKLYLRCQTPAERDSIVKEIFDARRELLKELE